MDQWARPLVETPRPLVHRPTRGGFVPLQGRIPEQASGAALPPMGLEMGALGAISADARHKAAPPAPIVAHRP